MHRARLLHLVLFSAPAYALVLPRPATVPLSRATGPSRACAPHALAPSGIDGLSLPMQAATVAAILACLAGGSAGINAAYGVAGAALPPGASDAAKRLFSVLIGAAFIAGGSSHFLLTSAYLPIVPPQGTWGFWYLPGSAEFHVAWTGAAEVLGGAGLLVGGAAEALGFDAGGRATPLRQLSASALLLLTFAISPANVYMYTHGALMPGAGPEGPLALDFHYVRFAIQVVLLSQLAALSGEEGPQAPRAEPPRAPPEARAADPTDD